VGSSSGVPVGVAVQVGVGVGVPVGSLVRVGVAVVTPVGALVEVATRVGVGLRTNVLVGWASIWPPWRNRRPMKPLASDPCFVADECY
jgi:hypothetical protein